MGRSNGGERGSAEDRRRRREWLVQTYRANVDGNEWIGPLGMRVFACPRGTGVPACRCYRCGELLTVATLTVDRITPGCKGGKYVRNNIRPSCRRCAIETGLELRHEGKRAS